jgi:glutathione-regulated potassium-efflux system ancillary protein KefG
MTTGSTLVVLAHPAMQVSRVNRALASAARRIDGVTVTDLYALYPTFYIDARREQHRLLEFDAIVLQHPLYWYHMPALLKEWVDLVLEYGWAYGGGHALAGKRWTHAFSTGSQRAAYAPDGTHHHPVGDFTFGFEQTALLCGMHWRPPFVTHDARRLGDDELGKCVADYAGWLTSLHAGTAALP